MAAAVCCAGAYGADGPKPLARFTLRDYLNRDWQNELVTFAVNPDLASRKDLVLLDGGGKSVAFQWCVEGAPAIAFLASLPKLGQVEYRLAEGRERPAPDLELREGADFLELASDEAGIRLHKNPKAAQGGPIAGVRLGSGRFVGAGELHLAAPPGKFRPESSEPRSGLCRSGIGLHHGRQGLLANPVSCHCRGAGHSRG